jgi:antirestriction protein ArdC
MNTESTQPRSKSAVAEIITQRFMDAIVKTGTLPWQKPWKSVFLRNATSGRPYHGVNVITLALFGQGHDFITFNQAKERGGMVRKGSKGLPVIYCRMMEKKDRFTGEIVKRSDGKPAAFPMLRYSTVFNLADIDGCDSLKAKCAERTKQIDFSPIEACERIAAEVTAPVTHGGGRACYIPAIHVIQMPERDSFRSVEAYYCTLFHDSGLLISAASRASARFNLLLKRAGLIEDESETTEETIEESATVTA